VNLKDKDRVTVCDHCLRACCWQGEFMCDEARGAGTTTKTVALLRRINAGEHEDYWKREVFGLPPFLGSTP